MNAEIAEVLHRHAMLLQRLDERLMVLEAILTPKPTRYEYAIDWCPQTATASASQPSETSAP